MIVRTIEMLLEYMAIILCIHKISSIRFDINKWNVCLFFIDIIVMLGINSSIISPYSRCVIYFLIIAYIKIIAKKNWNKAISMFGSVMITIISLQFVIFYIFKILHIRTVNIGIVINFIICLLSCIWKQKYFYTIIKFLNATKGIIISLLYLLIFMQIIYLGETKGYLRMEMIFQFLAETIGLSIVVLLWIGSEIKNKQKVRELQMYEMYNQAFEETIATVRIKQHEFENHLNAIKCMRYTIKDKEELLKVQEEYCNSILQESSINQLLKLHLEPALVGFLYSKITNAIEKDILVIYDIQPIDIGEKILVYELIEVIGILFDNAIEAMESIENKKIILKIIEEESRYFCFEVANKSRIYHNNEIEKFVKYGYSTKGENRGVGLVRVRDIAKKYKAVFEIGNYVYNNENYLRFRIKFER